MEIGAVRQVADAYDGAESVIGETLKMIDEIVASIVFLRHSPVEIMLESDVAVKIDLGGHDGLAGEADAGGARGNGQLATTSDFGEAGVLDEERGVFDDAAVAGDEAGAFKQGSLGMEKGGEVTGQ